MLSIYPDLIAWGGLDWVEIWVDTHRFDFTGSREIVAFVKQID
jgi:hypothetical protein